MYRCNSCGLGLKSQSGNLGVWGSNPGDGEQNFRRGQRLKEGNGKSPIHSLVIGLGPLDMPSRQNSHSKKTLLPFVSVLYSIYFIFKDDMKITQPDQWHFIAATYDALTTKGTFFIDDVYGYQVEASGDNQMVLT